MIASGLLGGSSLWEFGDGNVATPPIANADKVFVGTMDGTVYAFTRKGKEIWSGVAGRHITAYQTLAAGEGILVAVARGTVSAFGN